MGVRRRNMHPGSAGRLLHVHDVVIPAFDPDWIIDINNATTIQVGVPAPMQNQEFFGTSLSLVATDAAGGDLALDFTVTGFNQLGEKVEETIVFAAGAGTDPIQSLYAYDWIESLVFNEVVSPAATDTVDIGLNHANLGASSRLRIGLPFRPQAEADVLGMVRWPAGASSTPSVDNLTFDLARATVQAQNVIAASHHYRIIGHPDAAGA